MGWLFMQSLGRFDSPREYLDDQFAGTREEAGRETYRSAVLRSSMVAGRTYYAAVEVQRPDHDRVVFAAVCLVRYNPRGREGYIFGYKDQTENMGPCEVECPPKILDLLTPTTHPWALEWREKCRATATKRANTPRLRNGWTLVFEEPLTFSDGAAHARLDIVIDPRWPRRVRLRPSGGVGLYRVGDLGARRFTIEPTA